jgi:hypothetical protein
MYPFAQGVQLTRALGRRAWGVSFSRIRRLGKGLPPWPMTNPPSSMKTSPSTSQPWPESGVLYLAVLPTTWRNSKPRWGVVHKPSSGKLSLVIDSGVLGSGRSKWRASPSAHDCQAAGDAPLPPRAPAAPPPPPHLICPELCGRTPPVPTYLALLCFVVSPSACGTSRQWFARAGFYSSIGRRFLVA